MLCLQKVNLWVVSHFNLLRFLVTTSVKVEKARSQLALVAGIHKIALTTSAIFVISPGAQPTTLTHQSLFTIHTILGSVHSVSSHKIGNTQPHLLLDL